MRVTVQFGVILFRNMPLGCLVVTNDFGAIWMVPLLRVVIVEADIFGTEKTPNDPPCAILKEQPLGITSMLPPRQCEIKDVCLLIDSPVWPKAKDCEVRVYTYSGKNVVERHTRTHITCGKIKNSSGVPGIDDDIAATGLDVAHAHRWISGNFSSFKLQHEFPGAS